MDGRVWGIQNPANTNTDTSGPRSCGDLVKIESRDILRSLESEFIIRFPCLQLSVEF